MFRLIITIFILLSGVSGRVRVFSESHGKAGTEKPAGEKLSAVEKPFQSLRSDSGDIRSSVSLSLKDSLSFSPTSSVRKRQTDTLSGFPLPSSAASRKKPETRYTIQICSMSFPLSDSFFKGQYGVKVMRMGDLYRYVYSVYDSLPAARKDLPKIRKIYPDAFIREFDENKLGKAIDLNIENLK